MPEYNNAGESDVAYSFLVNPKSKYVGWGHGYNLSAPESESEDEKEEEPGAENERASIKEMAQEIEDIWADL